MSKIVECEVPLSYRTLSRGCGGRSIEIQSASIVFE